VPYGPKIRKDVLKYIEIAEPDCLLPTYKLQLNRSTAIVNDIFRGLDHWEYIRVVCACVRVRRGSKDSRKGMGWIDVV